MAGWHVVEKYLEEVGKHSTLIGKYWITMFLVLRLLILFSICDSAFGDVGLECDTKTPGCQKMCINQFYPIQPGSYWSLQMLFISLPIMLYMVYVSHKQEKINISRKIKKAKVDEEKNALLKALEAELEKNKADSKDLESKVDAHNQLYEDPQGKRYKSDEIQRILDQQSQYLTARKEEIIAECDRIQKSEDNAAEGADKATKASGKDNSTPPKLFLGYALMVLVRTVIDALFIAYYFQVYSFTFVMPEQYQCERSPCNNVVACYIDRPKQKTLVIYIMFATGCITVLVGIIEFFHLGMGKIYEAWVNRHDDITKQYKVSQFDNEKNYNDDYQQQIYGGEYQKVGNDAFYSH